MCCSEPSWYSIPGTIVTPATTIAGTAIKISRFKVIFFMDAVERLRDEELGQVVSATCHTHLMVNFRPRPVSQAVRTLL